MRTRNHFIILLLTLGIALYGVIVGYIEPKQAEIRAEYLNNQQNPITHDFESVLKYKNKYMGNSSNTSKLFRSLPLSNIEMFFRLYPEQLTAEVNYKGTVLEIGEDKVNLSLIYNATVSFVLIDNLEELILNFDGKSYSAMRKDVEEWYGVELMTLTDLNNWKEIVQNKLVDREYTTKCFNSIFTEG